MPGLRLLQARSALVGAALALAALACNLSTIDPPATAPPPPIRTTATQPITITPLFAIQTPTPTATDIALPNPTQAPPTVVNCFPQTTWPIYVVVPGDTLSRIAERTGGTTAQLAQANCLADPGLIYVGQRLYVPSLPPMPTAVPTADPQLPRFTQALTVEPYWRGSDGQAVTYSETVRAQAGEVPNADSVAFYVTNAAGGPTTTFGTDIDPWDGTFADYTFPAPGVYVFQAAAINEFGSVGSQVFTLRYNPNYQPPGGQRNLLSVAPYVSLAGGAYVLQPGATVTITWPDAPPGALRVEFRLYPSGTDAGPGQLIATDPSAADGAAAVWLVPQGILGHLQAAATMPDGSTQLSELQLVYTGS